MSDAATPTPDEDAGATTRGEVGGRNLPVAIVSGVLMAGLFLGSLFWHPLAFTIVVLGFLLVAIVESGAVLRGLGIHVAVPPLLAGGVVMLFGAYRSVHAGQAAGLLVLFLGSVAWLLADTHRHDVLRTLAVTMFLGLWAPFLASYAVLLRNRPEDGVVAALAVIGGAILGDVGGYTFGVRFGRTRIAPHVSPKKSLEGLLGGLFTSGLLGALVLPRVGELFTPWTAAAVAMLCVLAGFVGDLVESMVKRDLGIKDLGRILPGHGGVLDRVDGILVALPVGFYAIVLLT